MADSGGSLRPILRDESAAKQMTVTVTVTPTSPVTVTVAAAAVTARPAGPAAGDMTRTLTGPPGAAAGAGPPPPPNSHGYLTHRDGPAATVTVYRD